MKKILMTVMACVCATGFAQTASEDIQAKLNAMRTMSASFTQKVTAGNREVSQSSGSMALSRPGKFRWETKRPLEQVVVADSQKLWVYDVDLEQVTVKKQEKGLGGTPGLFLSGNSDSVNRDFTVTSETKNKTQIFDLKAKSSKENYQRVKLIYTQNQLTAIEFFDQLGQHTVIKLTNIKSNPKLADKLFQFKPPKGVDVVDQ